MMINTLEGLEVRDRLLNWQTWQLRTVLEDSRGGVLLQCCLSSRGQDAGDPLLQPIAMRIALSAPKMHAVTWWCGRCRSRSRILDDDALLYRHDVSLSLSEHHLSGLILLRDSDALPKSRIGLDRGNTWQYEMHTRRSTPVDACSLVCQPMVVRRRLY